MRLVDADHLVSLVNDATILGDGFKQAFTAIVNGEPTIEPERKKGKWIATLMKDLIGFNTIRCRCSECGYVGVDSTLFCPYCGADMREEQDETD